MSKIINDESSFPWSPAPQPKQQATRIPSRAVAHLKKYAIVTLFPGNGEDTRQLQALAQGKHQGGFKHQRDLQMPKKQDIIFCLPNAGIAQLVERNLAKVEVASSRLVSRSKFLKKAQTFVWAFFRLAVFFSYGGVVTTLSE